ncbi:MAG: hypothetical protein ACKPKO_23815, partial [Candidatus Fonsibacter sp.]
AFVLRSSDLQKATEVLEFDNGIGTWRISKDSNINLPTKTIQKIDNVEIKIEPLIVNQLDVPDEYDTTYICKLFENTNG